MPNLFAKDEIEVARFRGGAFIITNKRVIALRDLGTIKFSLNLDKIESIHTEYKRQNIWLYALMISLASFLFMLFNFNPIGMAIAGLISLGFGLGYRMSRRKYMCLDVGERSIDLMLDETSEESSNLVSSVEQARFELFNKSHQKKEMETKTIPLNSKAS